MLEALAKDGNVARGRSWVLLGHGRVLQVGPGPEIQGQELHLLRRSIGQVRHRVCPRPRERGWSVLVVGSTYPNWCTLRAPSVCRQAQLGAVFFGVCASMVERPCQPALAYIRSIGRLPAKPVRKWAHTSRWRQGPMSWLPASTDPASSWPELLCICLRPSVVELLNGDVFAAVRVILFHPFVLG